MATSICAPADAEIPRVVHQSWRSRELPSTLRPMSESWSRLPGWCHRLWTDDENRALWAQHFPELLDVYDAEHRSARGAVEEPVAPIFLPRGEEVEGPLHHEAAPVRLGEPRTKSLGTTFSLVYPLVLLF